MTSPKNTRHNENEDNRDDNSMGDTTNELNPLSVDIDIVLGAVGATPITEEDMAPIVDEDAAAAPTLPPESPSHASGKSSHKTSATTRKRRATHPLDSCQARADFYRNASLARSQLLCSSSDLFTLSPPKPPILKPDTSSSTINSSTLTSLSSTASMFSACSEGLGGNNNSSNSGQNPRRTASRAFSMPSLLASDDDALRGFTERRRFRPDQLELLHSVIIDYDERLNQEVDELFDFRTNSEWRSSLAD